MSKSRPATSIAVAVTFGAALVPWWFVYQTSHKRPGNTDASAVASSKTPVFIAPRREPVPSDMIAVGVNKSDEVSADSTLTPAQVQHQDEKISAGLRPGTTAGLLVTDVPSGSVVQQLALSPGDVILSMNGRKMSSIADFAETYREHGLPVPVEIERDGRILHRH
jgi:S1-C subfamily serine protease